MPILLSTLFLAGKNVPVFGVKGPSVLHDFVNIPSHIVIDSLHACYENVSKMFLNSIFDSANKHANFYLGRRQSFIDNMLRLQKSPCNMSPFPPLSTISWWKAHDFKHLNFIFVYPLFVVI